MIDFNAFLNHFFWWRTLCIYCVCIHVSIYPISFPAPSCLMLKCNYILAGVKELGVLILLWSEKKHRKKKHPTISTRKMYFKCVFTRLFIRTEYLLFWKYHLKYKSKEALLTVFFTNAIQKLKENINFDCFSTIKFDAPWRQKASSVYLSKTPKVTKFCPNFKAGL